MPFLETGAERPAAAACSTADAWSSARRPRWSAARMSVILVIGTPVDEFLGPSMRVFERAVDQITPHLRDGALVVLRSTVYPGTTEYVAAALEDRGCRVDVAFCPERIAEGHALEELHSLPQIIGADTERAADARRSVCSGIWQPRPSGPPARRPSSPSCSRTPGAT